MLTSVEAIIPVTITIYSEQQLDIDRQFVSVICHSGPIKTISAETVVLPYIITCQIL